MVVFEEFTEAKLGSNGRSLTILTPGGVSEGDLLIAVVVTDGNETILPPGGEGWAQIAHNTNSLTLGVWWKLAGSSESSSHEFTWGSNEQAYGWMMRFTGHDALVPIHVSAVDGGKSSVPVCPAVTTTVDNCLILRLGGFDDDDIVVDSPGLTGHTAVTMDESGSGGGTCSGGAGYVNLGVAGSSGTADFWLTASEQWRTVTVAIAPGL